MKKVVRTREQIKALKKALQDERDALPEYNIFGESTLDSKQEITDWIADLDYALKFNEAAGSSSEADYWLTDKGSLLGADYGIK